MLKLTVCIPTYNRSEYLKKCIESVLAQSLEEFKIIVLDNASTDNTKEIVDSFSDTRIEYYCHEKNIGGVGNINFAFKNAKGKYIVIFHDDDIMKKNYLEEMYAFMEKNEKCAMVSCLNDEIDEEGLIICANKTNDNNFIFESGQLLKKYIFEQYNLIFPTIMYRVESIKKYNIHVNSVVGPCADVIMYLDAEKQGACIGIVNKALVESRIHTTQDSSQNFGGMLISLMKYMLEDEYYNEYLKDNSKGQKKYYNWFAKNIIIKVASKSIIYSNGKKYIEQMGQLLKYNVIDKCFFNMILLSEKIFPNIYYKAYMRKKRKQRRG